MLGRVLCLLLSLANLPPSAAAQAETWLEIRTPAFTVITNSTEKDGRRVGRQFEQMRGVFHRVYPEVDLETATPILVLAVSDKKNLEAVEPAAYLVKGQISISGLFVPSAERTYVLLWLAGAGRHPYAPIYHEYTHFVTSRTGQWMPLWLTEGLAQFYENTEVLENEVRIGEGIAGSLELLQHNQLLPLETLFAVDVHSPNYHEENSASVFYAESWALTHYLKTKDVHDGTHLIDDYIALVNKKIDPVAAATQAFGDLEQLRSELRKYVVSGNYSYLPLDGSIQVEDSSFAVRTLGKAEADTVRADFMAHNRRTADAKALLESVLKDDPSNAAALETLGFAALGEHNYDEARKWCEQAAKIDSQNFFAHYCFAAATMQKGMSDSTSVAATESSLRTAIRLNPSFALAYDALGMSFAYRGKNLDEAYASMQKAVQLDPGTVEIRIDEAQVLMRMNRDKEAAEVLDLALKMSHTPEQTAAIETVQQNMKKYVAERGKMRQPTLTGIATGPGPKTSTNPAVTDARAIYTPQPDYTEQARVAKLQGACVLSLTVGLDGNPSNIVVTKKLGMGLDERAIEAVKKWKFEPARRYGRPVLTHLTLSIQFKLFGQSTEKFLDLSEKAKTGDPAAEFELAKAFLDGKDIPKDETQGLALLERAARDGQPLAQFQMAERVYGDGNNPENYIPAYVWYALAQRGGVESSDKKIIELESRMTYEQLAEARKRVDNTTMTSADKK